MPYPSADRPGRSGIRQPFPVPDRSAGMGFDQADEVDIYVVADVADREGDPVQDRFVIERVSGGFAAIGSPPG